MITLESIKQKSDKSTMKELWPELERVYSNLSVAIDDLLKVEKEFKHELVEWAEKGSTSIHDLTHKVNKVMYMYGVLDSFVHQGAAFVDDIKIYKELAHDMEKDLIKQLNEMKTKLNTLSKEKTNA